MKNALKNVAENTVHEKTVVSKNEKLRESKNWVQEW